MSETMGKSKIEEIAMNTQREQNQAQNFQKTSSNGIVSALNENMKQVFTNIKDRVRLLYQRNSQLQQQQKTSMSEIAYADPSNIKLKFNSKNNQNKGQPEEDNDSYELLKEVVKKCMRNEIFHSPSQLERQEKQGKTFARENHQLQFMIQGKMKKIESLEGRIREMKSQEYESIEELELLEEKLRNILKFDGPLEEAQTIQKEKRKSIYSIRHIREVCQGLKDQKCAILKETIRLLERLILCRKSRIERAEQSNEYQLEGKVYKGQQIYDQLTIFIENIGKLDKMISKTQQSKQKTVVKTYEDVTAFTPRNSQQIFKESSPAHLDDEIVSTVSKKSRNSLFPKYSPIKSGNIKNSSNPFSKEKPKCQTSRYPQPNQILRSTLQFPASSFKKQTSEFMITQQQLSNQNFEEIISQYSKIMKKLIEIQKQEIEYFNNKEKQFREQYKTKAIEAVYIKGILGKETTSAELIKTTIQKCSKFQESLSKRLQTKVSIQEKIDSIEETKVILEDDIELMSNEAAIKKRIYQQIQAVVKKYQRQQAAKQIQVGNETQQLYRLDQLKCQLKIKKKQLQEYAQNANLQGYKQTKKEIEELNQQLKIMENYLSKQKKMKEKKNSGIKNQGKRISEDLWSQIQQIFVQNGDLEVPVFVGKDMEHGTLLSKLGKRLLLI